MSRIRYSIQELQAKFDSGEDRSLLENVVRAFRGIQALPPDDPNSFFELAGYHGEPFRGVGASDGNWWGGYCNHGTVLFPTWHRAYCLRLEDAMRSIEGCHDVTLPFWDECFTPVSKQPIPAILTAEGFQLDGKTIRNPLRSYRLQRQLREKIPTAKERYTKPENYETCRYPLSGLVGPHDKVKTEAHNEKYASPEVRTHHLNANVRAWLDGKVKIKRDPKLDPKEALKRYPDTYSILSRFRICLDAPDYTVFSNTTSQNQYLEDNYFKPRSHWVVSLESPHNAMHLAVGGFYQEEVYNADPIVGANGDMGDNETASFDPIFFLHHCFIDYVFWIWQQRHKKTAAGSLAVRIGYPGTVSAEGAAGIPPNSQLDVDTPLYPFRKPDNSWYRSCDLTDIKKQLDYAYVDGSLDRFADPRVMALEGIMALRDTADIVTSAVTRPIDRTQYPGSFVIRTYVEGPKGEDLEIGREAVLSRWNVQGCANCQGHLNVRAFTQIPRPLIDHLGVSSAKDKRLEYRVDIQAHDGVHTLPPEEKLNKVAVHVF